MGKELQDLGKWSLTKRYFLMSKLFQSNKGKIWELKWVIKTFYLEDLQKTNSVDEIIDWYENRFIKII